MARIPTARSELLALLAEDADARARFRRQCRQGLIGLHACAERFRSDMARRGHLFEAAEVEVAVPELARVVLPGSPAAAYECLLSRILAGEIGHTKPVGSVMRLCAADHRHFSDLTRLALDVRGPELGALAAVSRGLHAELRRRGYRHNPRGFSQHVWRAVSELFPSAPGVRWDPEWAADLRRLTLRDFAGRTRGMPLAALDTVAFEEEFCAMSDAEEGRDRRAYVLAVRRAVLAGRRAAGEAPKRRDRETRAIDGLSRNDPEKT